MKNSLVEITPQSQPQAPDNGHLNGHHLNGTAESHAHSSNGHAPTKPSSLPIHPDNIPDELKQLPQWVCWKWELRADSKGALKWTKPLHNARTGHYADSTRAETWAAFEEALAAAPRFDGIGVVFSPDDPHAGVDLDNCIDAGGVLAPWAADIVAQLDTYAEVSPSGTGLKLWVKGALPPGGRSKGGRGEDGRGKVEVFNMGRYFTVTGHSFDEVPKRINERSEQLAVLHKRIFDKPISQPPASSPTPSTPVASDDAEIIRLASDSKSGPKFSRLWHGDTGDYDADQSRADAALCQMLAFWTARDTARMDALFRQSGLMRDKWNKRHRADGATYGQMTVESAAANCNEVYSPSSGAAQRTTAILGRSMQNGSAPDKAATAADPEREPFTFTTDAALDDCLSEIEWLWPSYIPKGFLTMVAGDQDQGKSTVVQGLCDIVLRGTSWPDGQAWAPAPDTNLLWIDTEGSIALFHQRAKAWGMPRGRFILPSDPLQELTIDNAVNWLWIERAIEKFAPPMVVIDALSGAHGSTENGSDEMKPVMKKLAALAQRYNIAVVVVHHLNKPAPGVASYPVSIHRLRGSTAISQYCRSILTVGTPDPAHPDARRLDVIKLNLARKPAPVGYELTDQGPAWGEAPEPPKERRAVDDAVDFLEIALATGPRPAQEVQDEAKAHKIGGNALRDALKVLKVKPRREGGTNGRWFWFPATYSTVKGDVEEGGVE